jgi:hypothetical protein
VYFDLVNATFLILLIYPRFHLLVGVLDPVLRLAQGAANMDDGGQQGTYPYKAKLHPLLAPPRLRLRTTVTAWQCTIVNPVGPGRP